MEVLVSRKVGDIDLLQVVVVAGDVVAVRDLGQSDDRTLECQHIRAGVPDEPHPCEHTQAAAYVYQFDRVPADDVHALGATHCSELPFLFGTFDAYPDSPMLGRAGGAERALGQRFATAVAEFVTSGSVSDWSAYSTGHVQHFS